MNRGSFALFHWSLTRDARHLTAHLVRGGFALLLLLVLAAAWFRTLEYGAAGLHLFSSICWMNLAVTTVAAVSYFSTSVTEESEAGNLGLLKLAGMGGLSILLGKSTSRLVVGCMLLLVQFPFTLLAITLGGVTLIQILAAYVAIVAHLILVANLAMFFSVFSRTSTWAAARTLMVVGLFYGGLWLVTTAAGVSGRSVQPQLLDRLTTIQASLSVTHAISVALNPGFGGPVLTLQFWLSLVLAVVLFALACAGFERATARQVPKRAVSSGRRRRGLLRLLGVSRAWSHAVAWKEFYYLTGGRMAWAGRWIVFAGLAVFLCQVAPHPDSDVLRWRWLGHSMSLSLLSVTGLELVIFASRILYEEVRWGTLPLLLMLPVSPRQMLFQKAWGAALACVPAVACIVLVLQVLPEPLPELRDYSGLVYLTVNYTLLLHFVVLLSLRMRAMALPAAVGLVFALNACCPVMTIGLILNQLAEGAARLPVALMSLAAYWLLLLLPLELEITTQVEENVLENHAD